VPVGEEFRDFYRAAYPRLVAQLYAVTADLALAEELVQEAFVRAASRWPQVGTYQAPEAWVRKMALRLRLDALRRIRRQAVALTRLGACRPVRSRSVWRTGSWSKRCAACRLAIARCWCCTTAWIAPLTTSRPAWGYLPRP